jgi:hypothetical protein
MTSTGRHLDETQAGIPNAPNERADLYGRSHCERHQGQLPKGRTQRPDIWAHRSRMRSAKEKRALDRGVVPHMGIPSESALLRIGINAVFRGGRWTIPPSQSPSEVAIKSTLGLSPEFEPKPCRRLRRSPLLKRARTQL